MARHTWTLTDVAQDVFVETLALSPQQVGGKATGYAVTKRTLRGGLRDGVDLLEVDNGTLRFALVPTRGMGLWRASLGQLALGWQSPVQGPVHPAFVRLNEGSGIGWLDGFDELLVRCGLESNGAPEFDDRGGVRYPLHGKIANLPAHKVELAIDDESGEITVTGEVDEARLFGPKLRLVSRVTTRVGQPGLTILDTVTNLSAEPGEMQLLYHTNFGLGLADPGAKAVVPIQKMAPRDARAVADLKQWDTYGPQKPGAPEAVFLFQPACDAEGRTRTLLHNAAGTQGVSLQFNTRQLPYFALWKNPLAVADGYVTGLEPALNFPGCHSFEKAHGRVAPLAPGESRRFEITLEVHPSAESVTSAIQDIRRLQEGTTPTLLSQPDPEWS